MMDDLEQRRLLKDDKRCIVGLILSLLGFITIQGVFLFSQRAANLSWAIVLLAWVLGVTLLQLRQGIALAMSLMLFTGFLNRITYNFEDVNFQFLLVFPELVTIMLVGVWALRAMSTGQRTVRLYWALDGWVLAYMGIVMLQIFNPQSSIMVGLYGARAELLPICMYFFSRLYFRETGDVVRFYKLLIVLGSIVVAYALFQHIWGLPDLEFAWLEHNPQILAQKARSIGGQMGWYIDGKLRFFSFLNGGQEYNFLMTMFFILLFVYNPLRRSESGWRGGRILFLGLYVIFLVLSLERTPIVMIMLGLITAFVIRGPLKQKRTFILLVSIVLVVGLAVITLLVARDRLLALSGGNIFVYRLIEVITPFSAEAVYVGRFGHWENAIHLIGQNPLGYGLGCTLPNRATGMGRGILEAPHNYFLQAALELGWLGVVLLLVLFAQILRLTINQIPNVPVDKRLLLRALLGITVAIVACGMFNHPLRTAVGFYFWFLVGLIPVLSQTQRKPISKKD